MTELRARVSDPTTVCAFGTLRSQDQPVPTMVGLWQMRHRHRLEHVVLRIHCIGAPSQCTITHCMLRSKQSNIYVVKVELAGSLTHCNQARRIKYIQESRLIPT